MTVLFRLLGFLPLVVLHGVGAALGWLVWMLSPRYRRDLALNLKQAGLTRVKAAAIAEAGKAILELPKIWLRPQAEVVSRVQGVTGLEHIEAAWERGGGIVFLTPHMGCFEVTAQYYASLRPITVLYRRPKQAWVAPLIEQGRGAHLKLAPADLTGVRRLLKALRNDEAVGILPDQVPGKGEGVWLPFFGRPAYTMTLPARLAEAGATVLLAYAERLPWGRGYHLHVAPLKQQLAGTLEQRSTQIAAEIEALIVRCPQQYLWSYNRYKVPAGASLPPPPPSSPTQAQKAA